MSDQCEYCGKPLTGLMISTGTGMACESCYYKKHPFIPKDSFMAVLCNYDDPVLVRRLLEENVPPEIKGRIIDNFNREMTRRYAEMVAC